MNSELLFDLAWLFKVESVYESNRKRSDGGEAMRLFCISLDLETQARAKKREELEALYAGELE
jgi:hypothetical protein